MFHNTSMEMSDAARSKKRVWVCFWVFFVSELADKEQTENKNWNYILPFCLIELKDLCTNQIYCRY